MTHLTMGSAVADKGRFRADAFVLATGSSFEAISFQGKSKPGVRFMDSPGAYSGLGRALPEVGRAVVAGEGGRGLQIAERMSASGAAVTVLFSSWQHSAPSAAAAQTLFDAAREKGISVVSGRVERALGVRGLEAVLAEGRVMPADALVVVPRRTPHPLPSAASAGRRGGVLVGLDMMTSLRGVFSAGGCAELEAGNPPHSTLEDEDATSGRVAGANATGSSVKVPDSRRTDCHVFGLTWTRIGAGVAGALAAGFDAAAVAETRDGRSSCTIVYDRVSGAALGLEVVCGTPSGELVLPGLGRPASLKSLAYDCELGSSDISMVSETARLGLEAWSRF